MKFGGAVRIAQPREMLWNNDILGKWHWWRSCERRNAVNSSLVRREIAAEEWVIPYGT
jgi:hypothetical protein